MTNFLVLLVALAITFVRALPVVNVTDAAFNLEHEPGSDQEYHLDVKYFDQARHIVHTTTYNFVKLTFQDLQNIEDKHESYASYLHDLLSLDRDLPLCQVGSLNGRFHQGDLRFEIDRRLYHEMRAYTTLIGHPNLYIDDDEDEEPADPLRTISSCFKNFIFDSRAHDRKYTDTASTQAGEKLFAARLRGIIEVNPDDNLFELSYIQKYARLLLDNNIRYMFAEGSLKGLIMNELEPDFLAPFFGSSDSVAVGVLCQLGKYILDAWALGLKLVIADRHNHVREVHGGPFVHRLFSEEQFDRVTTVRRYAGSSYGTASRTPSYANSPATPYGSGFSNTQGGSVVLGKSFGSPISIVPTTAPITIGKAVKVSKPNNKSKKPPTCHSVYNCPESRKFRVPDVHGFSIARTIFITLMPYYGSLYNLNGSYAKGLGNVFTGKFWDYSTPPEDESTTPAQVVLSITFAKSAQ